MTQSTEYDEQQAKAHADGSGFVTLDSGQRQEFDTGSRRDTRDGKGRFDLIPTLALRRLAGLYERGAAKYGDRNWEKGQPVMRYVDSLYRHLLAVIERDEAEDHAAAIIWNGIGILVTIARVAVGDLPAELDDRPAILRPAPALVASPCIGCGALCGRDGHHPCPSGCRA